MASKYLSAGTASYAAGTRTVSGATVSPVFASSDVGKGVVFRIGTAISYSRVESFISTTSVALAPNASLPGSNGTIAELVLLDLGESHTYADYLSEINAKIKDEPGQNSKLSIEDQKKYLKAAVTNYGRDKGHAVKLSVSGNGTKLYALATILGAYWKYGSTQIQSIQFPGDNTTQDVLEQEDWDIYDDGTAQDGSNLKLRFFNVSPSAIEKIIVEVSVEMSLPEIGAQNFPDTAENFENVTTLASAFSCFALAAAYAPSMDHTIGADFVNYNDKSRKYSELGRNYQKRYLQSVFGDEDPSSQISAAFRDIDLDTMDSQGQDFLNHDRRHR